MKFSFFSGANVNLITSVLLFSKIVFDSIFGIILLSELIAFVIFIIVGKDDLQLIFFV